mgnify:CR=1 FL=1
MQRYFGAVSHGVASLCEDDIFHLTRVMRAKPGTQIEVVSEGKVYLCETTSFSPLKIEVIQELQGNSELPSKVILVAALVKGEKMDLVLQKATELGVSEIVLLETERTIVKIKDESKLERFRKILKEASEQSKRTVIPTLNRVISINKLSEVNADVKMIAYENEKGSTNSFNKLVNSVKTGQSVAIVIGPEGGFSENEVEQANKLGFTSVGLGKRILRAETAVFYTLSVIANYLEGK